MMWDQKLFDRVRDEGEIVVRLLNGKGSRSGRFFFADDKMNRRGGEFRSGRACVQFIVEALPAAGRDAERVFLLVGGWFGRNRRIPHNGSFIQLVDGDANRVSRPIRLSLLLRLNGPLAIQLSTAIAHLIGFELGAQRLAIQLAAAIECLIEVQLSGGLIHKYNARKDAATSWMA